MVANRMILGELSAGEIAERSSPSYREKGRGKNKNKQPLASAARLLSEDTSKLKPKKVHFESQNVLNRPESPSAKYHKNCHSSPSKSNGLPQSPRASRVSALKKNGGRFSPMGKSAKARDYSPTSRLQDSQLYNIMAEIDKENMSPVHSATASGRTTKVSTVTSSGLKRAVVREENEEFIVECYSTLEQSIQDMSIDDLNHTMSESVAAMEGLRHEAESLMVDETTAGGDTILEQLELIRKKQEELQAIQKTLQEKLKHRKRKKRLDFEKQTDLLAEEGISDLEGKGNISADVAQRTSKKNKSESQHNKNNTNRHLERNVVDVSPIGGAFAVDGSSNSLGSNLILTPDEHGTEHTKYDQSDLYESSPTLFPVKKNESHLRQPLHSTAHDTQQQTKLDLMFTSSQEKSMAIEEEPSRKESVNDNEEKCGDWRNNAIEGGKLSQGLLQMAQTLNATPHKNLHWKKQYLQSKDVPESSNDYREGGGDNNKLTSKDSFYNNGETPNENTLKTPIRQTIKPIGTPFGFSHLGITPKKVSGTPLKDTSLTPTLLSGSAQLITSPIQTPLSLRESAARQHGGSGIIEETRRMSSEMDLSIESSSPEIEDGEFSNKFCHASPYVEKNRTKFASAQIGRSRESELVR